MMDAKGENGGPGEFLETKRATILKRVDEAMYVIAYWHDEQTHIDTIHGTKLYKIGGGTCIDWNRNRQGKWEEEVRKMRLPEKFKEQNPRWRRQPCRQRCQQRCG